MTVIARLELEPVYYNIAVQHVNFYTMGTLSYNKLVKSIGHRYIEIIKLGYFVLMVYQPKTQVI